MGEKLTKAQIEFLRELVKGGGYCRNLYANSRARQRAVDKGLASGNWQYDGWTITEAGRNALAAIEKEMEK